MEDYSKYNIYNTQQVLKIIGFVIIISFSATMIYAKFQIMEKKIKMLEYRIEELEIMNENQNKYLLEIIKIDNKQGN